ncbi:GNAT family N-acetyltransferase [Phormidesmis priestleyi]
MVNDRTLLTIKLAELPDDFGAIVAIRKTVFQIEQGVETALEFDGKDDEAIHWLAYLGARPVGTARVRFLDQSVAKLERLAVLPKARGQGIGTQIMQTAIAFLSQKNISEIRIHAQEPVKEFYEQLGFVSEGDRFYEANIPHFKMSKRLESISGRK